MILNSLSLSNFGTYEGAHLVNLTPPTPELPVILVMGLNGAGKTTFIEAIQLALYGQRSYFVQSKKLSFDHYLKNKIHFGATVASVTLEIELLENGESRKCEVSRSWKNTEGTVKFKTQVKIDGVIDNSIADTWDEFVESILPRGISGLFFFDGEQIESLADPETSSDILESAINSLIGLELVDRLGNDMSVLRRRTLKEELPPRSIDQIDELEENVRSLHSRVSNLEIEIAEQNEVVSQAAKHKKSAEESYRRLGGEAYDRREELQEKYLAASKENSAVLDYLRNSATGLSPLLMVWPLLDELRNTLKKNQSLGLSRQYGKELEKRDEWLLLELSKLLSQSDLETVKARLNRDRSEKNGLLLSEKHRSIRLDEFDRILNSLEIGNAETKRLLEYSAQTLQKLEQAETALESIPQQDSIQEVLERYQDASRLESEVSDELKSLIVQLDTERVRVERAESQLDKALQEQADYEFSAKENLRLLEHIERVKSTLSILKEYETKRHIRQISDLVRDSLKQLLRKGNLVETVRIDPSNFSLELRTAKNEIVLPSSLSAGERQLLSVALLWGLARTSGRPLPVVIDTPLGRLDNSHRKLLVERYFPHASHQVILLSTDTEIRGELFDDLEPFVGRLYELEFDNGKRATVITEKSWEVSKS